MMIGQRDLMDKEEKMIGPMLPSERGRRA